MFVEFEQICVFVNQQFYCHAISSKEAFGVAGLGVSNVTSLTSYRIMSAVFRAALKALYIHASRITLFVDQNGEK
jgi:hypothetical protein